MKVFKKTVIATSGSRVLIQVNDSKLGYVYDKESGKAGAIQPIESILTMSGGEWDFINDK